MFGRSGQAHFNIKLIIARGHKDATSSAPREPGDEFCIIPINRRESRDDLLVQISRYKRFWGSV